MEPVKSIMVRISCRGYGCSIDWETGERTWEAWRQLQLSDGWATVSLRVHDQVSTSE